MDADHDGTVTRAEWKGNDISFAMYDANGDGVLSGAELAPAVQPEAPAAAFARLDRNHDGSLAREEWTGPADDFDRLDHNQDGKVSRDEYLNLDRGKGRLEGLFRRLDKNRDGRIARAEWDGANFDRLDRNHDGYVTRDEFLRRQAV
jgi:Ca2+-binding EF-hand superfamily protein